MLYDINGKYVGQVGGIQGKVVNVERGVITYFPSTGDAAVTLIVSVYWGDSRTDKFEIFLNKFTDRGGEKRISFIKFPEMGEGGNAREVSHGDKMIDPRTLQKGDWIFLGAVSKEDLNKGRVPPIRNWGITGN